MEGVDGGGRKGRNFTWVLFEAASVTRVNATTADAAQIGGEVFQTDTRRSAGDRQPAHSFYNVQSLCKGPALLKLVLL